MAGSIYGRLFQISTWGESHGKGIGVVIDGCPAGLSLSEEDIQVYLDRRKPGQSQFTTGRKESDMAQICPAYLKAGRPELRFQFSYRTRISVPVITEIL